LIVYDVFKPFFIYFSAIDAFKLTKSLIIFTFYDNIIDIAFFLEEAFYA